MAMASAPPVRARRFLTISATPTLLLIGILAPAASGGAVPDPEPGPGPGTLVVVERSIVQDQGSWQVDYRLRHDGPGGVVVTLADVQANVEGWVSNSRLASHAVPRLSPLVVS